MIDHVGVSERAACTLVGFSWVAMMHEAKSANTHEARYRIKTDGLIVQGLRLFAIRRTFEERGLSDSSKTRLPILSWRVFAGSDKEA